MEASMVRKSRAQLDAEKMAQLEEAQRKMDSGESTPEEIEQELNGEEDLGPSNIEDFRNEQQELLPEKPAPKLAKLKAPEIDVEALQHELAMAKRTLSHYEQELNPTKQHAQELEAELAEARRQLAEAPKAPEQPLDYGLTDEEKEFETVKTISEKIALANLSKVERTLMARIDSMSKELSAYGEERKQTRIQSAIEKHRAGLTKILGEAPDTYFSDPKLPDWSANQSDEEVLALRNPVAYSEKFVAAILSRFKSEVRGQASRKPSHGESSVPSRVAPDVIERTGGSESDGVAFNPRTFQADVQKLIQNGRTADAQRLVEKAERAMSA
jgi:hypothetical protein